MPLRKVFPKILPTRGSRQLAAPPGSLVHFGARRTEKFTVRSIRYDKDTVEFREEEDVPDVSSIRGDRVDYYEVLGLHDVEKISALAKAFSLNPLVVEDILNTTGRPKIEKRDDLVFVVCRLVTLDEEMQEIDAQQCSFVLLPDSVLLSFLEAPTPAFEPVRERIRTGVGGRIRRYGADYLLWAVLDAVVDNYLHVVDHLDPVIIRMEEDLQRDADSVSTAELYALKRDIGQLNRAIRPIREITAGLRRANSDLLTGIAEQYFEDLNDHAVQVIESTEHLRDSASALRDFHLSAVSNRMNEVMKVLTCLSTIFLPMSFLAGIYGMNFEWIPELQYKWGYPLLWVFFLTCSGTMLWLFRRKKWI